MTIDTARLNYKKMITSMLMFAVFFCWAVVFILRHVYFGTFRYSGEFTVSFSAFIAVVYVHGISFYKQRILRGFRCGFKLTRDVVLIDTIKDEKHLSRAERANYYREYCGRHFIVAPDSAERVRDIEKRLRELRQDRLKLSDSTDLSNNELWLKRKLIIGEEACLLEELCLDYRLSTGVPTDELIRNG